MFGLANRMLGYLQKGLRGAANLIGKARGWMRGHEGIANVVVPMPDLTPEQLAEAASNATGHFTLTAAQKARIEEGVAKANGLKASPVFQTVLLIVATAWLTLRTVSLFRNAKRNKARDEAVAATPMPSGPTVVKEV